ncbi:MAG: MGMT family protein [Gammaproteobacteria bacterium]
MAARKLARNDQDKRLAAIWKAISSIPHGKVCSYGGVARLAGMPGRARYVGYALRHAPDELDLPWYRVITASGRLAFPTSSESWQRQKVLLESENIEFIDNRVIENYWMQPDSLDEYLWKPD